MNRRDWLSLVAVHSDSWLLSVAFFFGAPLNANERTELGICFLHLNRVSFDVLYSTEVRNQGSCAELEEEVARLGTLLVKGSGTAVRTMPL
ncbi:PHD finger protein [Hordeum vulgare]|nr:PHD finger protein [Hordeum vulgare]